MLAPFAKAPGNMLSRIQNTFAMPTDILHNARKFAATLSPEYRMALLWALQGGQFPDMALTRTCGRNLELAENWLRQRAETAPPAHLASRWRIWFIFILLRYGGLKLKEILSLAADDLDFTNCEAIVSRGGTRQKIPLPQEICASLKRAWIQWAPAFCDARPFACDTSILRRAMGQCAAACGIDAQILRSGALRRQRGQELLAMGMHPAIIAYFLGQTGTPEPFAAEHAQQLLKQAIQGQPQMLTSARNVFRGRISRISAEAILTHVTLTTTDGLDILATITATSRKNMAMAEGTLASALVKAPWVNITPLGTAVRDENCYDGTIERITSDRNATEILLGLQLGHGLCGLRVKDNSWADMFRTGEKIQASFSALSVILTVD